MEGRVEARDLRDARERPGGRLDQRDLPGEVFRVERGEPTQPVEQLRGDELRPGVPVPAVDDAVPDGRDRAEAPVSVEALGHEPDGRGLVRDLDLAVLTPDPARVARR